MASDIRSVRLAADLLRPAGPGFAAADLLSGEIPGVATRYGVVSRGRAFQYEPEKRTARVLVFLQGTGRVKCREDAYGIEEISVFAPAGQASFLVEAAGADLEYLEILFQLHPEEAAGRGKAGAHFVRYSQAVPYQEDIKSPKTVSRMLLGEGVVPRETMGSVETSGPDVVGDHRHPMLEQLFYGLPGNHCIVHADGREIAFGENTLLHIPKGSNHGARVEAGYRLHYLWIDFFESQDGMSDFGSTHRLMSSLNSVPDSNP